MPVPVPVITSLLAVATMSPVADPCAMARQATGYACQATMGGVVLAPEQREATKLAAFATAGEARWRRHFGGSTTPYAIVQTVKPSFTKALRAGGFPIVLPWLSPAEYAAASTASIRRATEAQLKARGMTDPALVEMAVKQAMSAWGAKHPDSEWLEKEAGAVPHEIGHMWYIARYWPKAAVDGTGHYGGPGPDWMDETAAVLLEDDRLANDRRKQFDVALADRSAEGAEARASLIDLATFLHREHPAKALQEMIMASAAASSGPRVMVLSAEEAKGKVKLAAQFYLQARLFADFLISRSGDQAIFAEIGAALGRGDSFEQWLGRKGTVRQVGRTVAEVQANWATWLAARPQA
jgi:hypothetical protein